MSTFIDGMPAEDYHAHPGVGSTTLKTLAKHPPAVYRHHMDHPEHKAAYDIGTAAHSLILEDDTSGLSIVNADDWRSKAAREEREAAYTEGTVPLLAKEFAVVEAMCDAVMAHPHASRLLTGHVAERSYFAEIGGAEAKCRADAVHEGIGAVVDLKTTTDADPAEFGRTAYGFGYHQQVAWYQDVIQAVTGFAPAFYFVLVEKTAPYLVSVVELTPEFVDYGREANARALTIYQQCQESGEWPGYTDPALVEIPRWARFKEDS